jgi:hypothetical protein
VTVTPGEFNHLSQEHRLHLALLHGTFLAQRREGDGNVNLYYLRGPGKGLFIEVYYEPADIDIVCVHGFTRSEPLEKYTVRVQLPDGL